MSYTDLQYQLDLLPEYLGHHMLLTMVALGIGIAVSLPLGCLITRVKPMQWPTLAVASVLQTIPGIALLALMVPILSMIGFVPAMIALILYSFLPILRNTVTGVLGVDPAITEAARGIGMTDMQVLFKVELPLALPVIVAGIRTATVWVVGTATLATPVGAVSLGNYIFSGLQTQNITAVIVGCIAAALLAISLDQLIRLVEVATAKRSKPLTALAGSLILVLVLGALSPIAVAALDRDDRGTVMIGSKTFTEQYILAEALSQLLDDHGFRADRRQGMGSIILFEALAGSRVDCYVDYTGTIWANAMNRDDFLPGDTLLQVMTEWLMENHGITTVGGLGFENTYALAVRREMAEEYGLESITDLISVADDLRIGSDYEFFSRPEWASLKETYNLEFAEQVTFDPSLMYSAVAQGQCDVITAFSTDGRIVAYDLVILDDPRRVFPPYDAVVLLSPEAARRSAVVEILKRTIGTISDKEMQLANKMVDVDGKPVDSAAVYLKQQFEGESETSADQTLLRD